MNNEFSDEYGHSSERIIIFFVVMDHWYLILGGKSIKRKKDTGGTCPQSTFKFLFFSNNPFILGDDSLLWMIMKKGKERV
jgi:hypothetical protein